MARMGHSSTRAALIYQHSTDERQREIADALNQLAREQLKRDKGKAAGQGAGKRSGTVRGNPVILYLFGGCLRRAARRFYRRCIGLP